MDKPRSNTVCLTCVCSFICSVIIDYAHIAITSKLLANISYSYTILLLVLGLCETGDKCDARMDWLWKDNIYQLFIHDGFDAYTE